MAAITVAAIRVGGGLIGIFLVQRFKRVALNMVMMTTMSVAMAAMGSVLYIKENYPDSYSTSLDIVPVIAVTVYMFCFGAGTGPLMWVYIAELLPREYKVLSGIVCSIGLIFVFTITKTYPTLLLLVPPYALYWLFAAIALSSNIFYWFCLPETRGKTPLEVKHMFYRMESPKA